MIPQKLSEVRIRYRVRKYNKALIAIAGVLAIWWALSGFLGRASRSEFLRLQRHMNSATRPDQHIFKKSSFDWSSISFRYSPGPLTPLPSSQPHRLPAVQAPPRSEGHMVSELRESRRQWVTEVQTYVLGILGCRAWPPPQLPFPSSSFSLHIGAGTSGSLSICTRATLLRWRSR